MSVHIVSEDNTPFKNRLEAGRLLGLQLEEYHGQSAVVLGIPRGGVVVARALAETLEADLDVVLARKIGAPGQPELAVGAVSEHGDLYINEAVAEQTGVSDAYLEEETERQLEVIDRRMQDYRAVHPKVPVKGRVVILTDDGIATGATMQAALWALRSEEPAKIIVALPVGPPESLQTLAEDADEVVCLKAPRRFGAVGYFFADFTQVEDNEVLQLLREKRH